MDTVRPVDKPLAWVGHDRLLLNDVTSLGLRRKVIARKDEMPNCVTWLQAAYQEATPSALRASPPNASSTNLGEKKPVKVHWWLVERNGFYFLWIVWKDERAVGSN